MTAKTWGHPGIALSPVLALGHCGPGKRPQSHPWGPVIHLEGTQSRGGWEAGSRGQQRRRWLEASGTGRRSCVVLRQPRWAWPEAQRCSRGGPWQLVFSTEGKQGQVGGLLKGQGLSGSRGSGGPRWDNHGKEKGRLSARRTEGPGGPAANPDMPWPEGTAGADRCRSATSQRPVALGNTGLVWPGHPKSREKPEVGVFM